ncbi:DUF6056 family protein [Companilactobacillus zhongbaensis]|uniref:DUF6056 family protein n=1 Tax=Companilactobacillus zhongbaensis TaxID=2486009 RepID=UPI000F799348|nr:DUF6056 family protein [Companilactobacillus zhongbaensis]
MSKTVKTIFYLISFLLFGFIGYSMPLLGDDINWGNYFGVSYFSTNLFTYYDGRYLGDVLVIIITRYPIVAFIAYGLVMTLIMYLVQKISTQLKNGKKDDLFAASLMGIFLLLMPTILFQQILGWHAGFANYAPSLIFPLTLLYLVVKNYQTPEIVYKKSTMVLFFIFALASQFFAEHITILNIFNDVLIYFFLRKQFGDSFKKMFYTGMIGNFLGAILMFVNGAYLNVLFGKDGYRSISGGENKSTLFTYFAKHVTGPKLTTLLIIVAIFTIAVIFYSWKTQDKRRKIVDLALLISGFAVILPFVVVSPFGARCLFASYVFAATIITVTVDPWLVKANKFVVPVLLLVFLAAGWKMDTVAKGYGDTYQMQVAYFKYQNTQPRTVQYFLQYADKKRIWAEPDIDGNLTTYYVKDRSRSVAVVEYSEWSKIFEQLQNKNFSSKNKFWQAFDKRVVAIMN